MAGSSTNVCIRVDTELKAQAESLFGELGLNLTTAFNIFLRQAVRERRIPFEITLERPNRETAAAIREAAGFARDPQAKGYADPKELFRDLQG